MHKLFAKWATKCSHWMGTPWAFGCALLLIISWAILGPFFDYSDSWELIINTATTIITFLMVFLIQNTQNRDARAMHLKIDELIFSLRAADNNLINIEELTPEELDELAKKYESLKKDFTKTRSSERHRVRHHRP